MKLPKLDVIRSPGNPRYRKVYHLRGLAPPGEVLVHNSNVANLVRGLAERVMYQKKDGHYVGLQEPESGAFSGYLSEFRSLFLRKLRCPPVELLDNVPAMYRGRQQTIMRDAVASLLVKRVTKRDSRTRPFVKAEKMLKPDPKPRIIQCRTPRYVAMCARYLKKLEKPAFQAINRVWGNTTVLKGLNGQERGRVIAGKWNAIPNCVAIGIDATAFDQHVSRVALKYEHSFYNGAYNRDELRRLLKWQLQNSGVGHCWDGKVRYKVDGKRMSGDLNTSLGNTILMCALVWSWAKETGVHCQFVNDGDDGVIFLGENDLPKMSGFQDWFMVRGFEMKVENPVRRLEKIEFCQCQPVLTSDGSYIMVRQPDNAIRKDVTSLVPLTTPKSFATWVSAVAQCGLALCTGVPVMEAFYRCLNRVGGSPGGSFSNSAFQSGFYHMSFGVNTEGNKVTPEVRYSFWCAFGIPPDVQIALEKSYDAIQLKYGHGPVPLDSSPTVKAFRAHPAGTLLLRK